MAELNVLVKSFMPPTKEIMPKFQLPEKLEPLLRPKPIKIVYGGRGGAKSMSIADILLMRVSTEGIKVAGMREMMNSIDDSVHSLFCSEIERLLLAGFTIQKNTIYHNNCGQISYKGLARNPESVKSMHGFDVFWIEEGATLSKRSLDLLLPTLRETGSELWMSLNPNSTSDPVAKEFLIPHQHELNKNGFYEDDLMMIIKSNYTDNPFFPPNLDNLRKKHYEEKSRAWYDHVWLGEYSDSVEDPLILAEWFDSCIDAHKKLGFAPLGIRYAAHDPSDEGSDAKGYAFRHGSVVMDVRERTTGNVNDGCDWATSLAIQHNVDAFTWDCDGMGVGLGRQVSKSFSGHATKVAMFKGSEGPDNPNEIYNPVEGISHQKTNQEAVKNKRAQYYMTLRDRIHRTFKAVNGEYHDPDELISFDSSIPGMVQLRSELCRMPVKPNGNGRFELYTKDVMKIKFKVDSPNLADSVMMLMRMPEKAQKTASRPAPIRPMGIRR